MHSFWSNFKRGACYTIWHLTISVVSWYVQVYIECAAWNWLGTNAYCYILWIHRDKSLSTSISFIFWEYKKRTGSSYIRAIIIIIMEQCLVKHTCQNFYRKSVSFHVFFRTQHFKNFHTRGKKKQKKPLTTSINIPQNSILKLWHR